MEITKHDDQLITHQNSGGLMTDEQIEVLRKQICVYSIICEQLVDLHKAMTAQQEIVAGANLGSLYCDSLITYAGQKLTSRHRWTPTAPQLQILERFFLQGNGTPCKQKIKEMTTELSQHGQISETNVYNWFQNRRARSKRKKVPNVAPNNATTESQVEAEKEKCSKDKTKVSQSGSVPEKSIRTRDSDAYFHNPEFHSLVAQYYNENPPFPWDLSFKPYEAFGHLDLRKSVKGSNQVINKMGD